MLCQFLILWYKHKVTSQSPFIRFDPQSHIAYGDWEYYYIGMHATKCVFVFICKSFRWLTNIWMLLTSNDLKATFFGILHYRDSYNHIPSNCLYFVSTYSRIWGSEINLNISKLSSHFHEVLGINSKLQNKLRIAIFNENG